MRARPQHIDTGDRRYLIRGNWSPSQLRQQYKSFQARYASELTFEQWLVQQGKVYVRLGSRCHEPRRQAKDVL